MAIRVSYPLFKAFTSSGSFGVGYKLYTYEAGTSTPLTTYQDSAATTPHANPIILDSLGEAEIFITESAKFTLTDADDAVQTGWPVDNIDPTTVTAAEVSYTPSGDLVSTNVQAAIDELVIDIEALEATSSEVVTVPAGSTLSGGPIAGLGYAQAADADHDITFAIGSIMDSTNAVELRNAAAMTKQIDATWAAGDAAGGLFSGASLTANTPYALFIIEKTSDGTIDFGFDDNITADNIPTGYAKYRCIGTVVTDSSSNIIDFNYNNGMITFKKASEVAINSKTTVPASMTAVSISAWVISTTLISHVLIGSQSITSNQPFCVGFDGTNTFINITGIETLNADTEINAWNANTNSSFNFMPITSTNVYWSRGGFANQANAQMLMHAMRLRI